MQFRKIAVRFASTLVALGASGAALAQTTGADYSQITDAVAIGGVITAIVAMAVVKIGPNVARWASNKLANFF